INRIVINPRNNDVVWVAATGPLFGPGGERGIFKTTDGGKTWKQTLKVDDDTGANDLVIDPSNDKILYASTYQRRRTSCCMNGGGRGGGGASDRGSPRPGSRRRWRRAGPRDDGDADDRHRPIPLGRRGRDVAQGEQQQRAADVFQPGAHRSERSRRRRHGRRRSADDH